MENIENSVDAPLIFTDSDAHKVKALNHEEGEDY